MAPPELTECIRKRGVAKGKLTRFGSFFDTFQRNARRNYTELKLRLDKLESLFDEFDLIQTEIEGLDESDSQQEERIKFENEFFSIQAAAVNELSSQELQSSDQSFSRNHRPGVEAHMKLPRINLPEFDGEYENWQCYRDTFSVMIHNARIPAVEKFQYLRLSLKGLAAQLIESLEVTEGNYLVAWNLVQERFENKRLIVQTHVSKLFAVNKLKNESASATRSFFDIFSRHLGALKAIGEPVDEWSTLLVHIASSKLDDKSLMEWETSRKDTSVPTWNEFTTFLNHRCQTLAAIEVSKAQGRNMWQDPSIPVRRSFTTLYQCPKFLALRTPERVKFARTINVCVNCLRGGHRASSCRSAGCSKCNQRHNSKLHLEDDERAEAFANSALIDEETGNSSDTQESIVDSEESQVALKAQIMEKRKTVGEVTMLSTALVIISDVRGKGIMARVLLDSGSQVNLMTTRLAIKLGYPITETATTVIGVSGMSCKAVGQVSATVKSRINAYSTDLRFLVLQNIANTLQSVQPTNEVMNTINLGECADPDFRSTKKIDIILGSEIFYELLCIGQIKPAGTRAIWQKTVFGWVLSGRVQSDHINPHTSCMTTMVSIDNSIQNEVQKFWELEEVVEPKERRKYSIEECKCETHFLKTSSRDADGRFTLKLPFRNNIQQLLGESRFMATKRFHQMERKLNENPELKLEYVRFMREYQNLGHMTLSTKTNTHSTEHPQWWSGPSWMIQPETEWPKQKLLNNEEEPVEQRKTVKVLHVHTESQMEFQDIVNRFSKLERLQRVTAYLFRAVTQRKYRLTGDLKAEELKRGLMYWVKITQAQAFSSEISQLKAGNSLNDSKLQSLVPFIDDNDVLRVGSRLQNSNESYEARHPIILPSTTYLVELIADKEHRRLIHAGPQQIVASLQRVFWIPGLRSVIQKIIFKCNPCYRWKVQASKQLMGSLPVSRANPSSIFHVCGVDYAGPFQVRFGSRKPLTALPEPNYLDIKAPRLRWHMVQQLVQGFWKRWRTEYLQSLQVRHKWTQTEENLQVGDLVLIREDYETPLAWSRGRILLLHTGSDGLVRVATVKTATTEMKRPIHKLCLLPGQREVQLNP
ncbi:unnamed protein product [Macrosiphum euphorbiae]|uniref:Uncharacterized protein n=1 Tax=Macrosiphum euphorbiae TaxID=13131 RepID=A0AAV0X7N6_9HEMI|nr:unnamed protein product [Macrosiphum euphorbiae]